MGFLSKLARKGIKKRVAQMPRRRGGFLSKIRNKAFDRIEKRKIPARSGFLRGQYFGPRGNMSSDFRMPSRGGFGNLGEAIRRLNEQQGMMPQPIPERMPVSNAPSFNPTIFGQPIGDIDFSNMPDFSQMDLTNLQVPTDMPMTTDDGRMYAGGSPGLYKPGGRFYNPGARLQMPQPIPRAEIDISALESLPMGDMPMAQDLPEVAPIGMMPQMRMGGMQDMQPRMMMQAGEDVSLERELFSLKTQLENLEEQLRLDRSYNDDQAVINTSAEMAAIQKRIQEILQESGRTISDMDRQQIGRRTMSDMDKGRTMSNMDRQMAVSNFLEQYGLTVPREVVEKLSQESGFSRQSIVEIIQEGGRTISDSDYNMSRPQLAGGDEVKSFADYQPEGSLKGTFFDYIPDGYQVSSFLIDKFGQEAAQNPTIREMFEKEFKAARMAGKDVFEFMGKPYNTKTLEEVEGMRYGGEMERFQDGGEIDAMLSGMDSEEAGAMEDLEQMAPEMEMIDQLVTMVVQMIQQGASEEEVIMFLREQGLDDEDIGTVLQLVAEMAEAEAMPQDGIGAELEQLV
jgi:hypothetical protein